MEHGPGFLLNNTHTFGQREIFIKKKKIRKKSTKKKKIKKKDQSYL